MGGIQNLMSGSGTLDFSGDQGLPINFGQDNGFLSTNATGLSLNYKPSKKASISSSFFFNTFDKTFDKSIDRTTYFQDSSLFSKEDVLQKSTTFNNRGNIHYKQEFDSTHFLNANFIGSWTNADYSNINSLYNFDSDEDLRNTYVTDLNQDKFEYSADLAVDYRKKFKKKGRYTGGGVAYNVNNSDASSYLSYQNVLYLTSPLFTDIMQNQGNIQLNSGLSADWMFSEPLAKKHLLQFQLAHYRSNHSREKEVMDELEPDNFLMNELLSGNADYMNYTNEAELKHKYLSKKFKTTVGAAYDNVNLVSDDFFAETRSYDYLLPFLRVQWDINKSSELQFDYRTRTNLPSLVQLQSIPNNTNPAELVLGNVNLNPEYVHDVSFEFNMFNQFNFMHFMMRLGAARVENKINYSQTIDANFNRTFTPENNGVEDQVNSYISFGTNLNPIKTKFSISTNSNVSQGLVTLNSVQNKYTSFYNNARLTIENTKKKVLNIKTGLETTYSKSVYAENKDFNGDFFSWNYSGDLTLKAKDKWIFNVNAKHYFYPGFDLNNEQIIMNASIARNLLKSKELQVYVTANDILNQNTGINQSYYLNYFEQERTATLARYFMIGIKYSFQKLGAK